MLLRGRVVVLGRKYLRPRKEGLMNLKPSKRRESLSLKAALLCFNRETIVLWIAGIVVGTIGCDIKN